MEARRVSDSVAEHAEIVLPNDANPFGKLLGGKVMHLVDLVGATAAMRHARMPVATASVDSMTFLQPVKIGQLLILKASINRVFNTSMEAGVKVFAEDLMTGQRWHTSSAYLTFVAMDQQGVRVPVPPIMAETPDEVRRFEEAGRRRQFRLEQRGKKC